ncbi:sulfatase family protein [Prosthecobacter vanneervenii]|uniref:Arylsulfatase A-like enzyme n=1 Tax=Prosthecobacter vanneervenii TaxID=48466 RepID=A0A7W7Y9F2_9BACT|nr:sulfatase [Prosthecobacter vanneervenii]MBB5031959.1 arylsulfatase A-like enzyme [Prosthecobacter vanneervenii]
MRHLLLCCLALTTLAAAADKPLNIVFLFADDWGRYASIYAEHEKFPSPNQVVKTPNIDRIAREGALFSRAYVNAPSCTPCRSALLSGRYFFNCGRAAILNGAVWDPAIPSYPLLLKDQGYHLGKSFKVWSPGEPADAPYGGQQFAYQKSGGRCNQFSEEVTKMVDSGVPLDAAKQQIYDEVRGNFSSFLAARPQGAPFVFWHGPTNVHRKWVKGSGQALWGINPDDLKGKLPKHLPDVPEFREDFGSYLGEIQAFDAQVGVIIKRLEEAGEYDNTVIVISGDHGAPGFPGGKCNLYDFGVNVTLAIRWPGQPGGRYIEDFVNLMDLAPTFMEIGGAKIPDGVNGKSLVSLMKSGKSGRIEKERDYVITGRERHVSVAREGNLPYPQRALRKDGFLYIHNFKPERTPMGDAKTLTDSFTPSQDELENETGVAFPDMDSSPAKAWLIQHRHDSQYQWYFDYAFAKRPEEELYDLSKDPDSTINVAAEPAYAEVKNKMAAELLAKLKAVGDPRVTADPVPFENPPYTLDTKTGHPGKGKKGKGKAKAKAE